VFEPVNTYRHTNLDASTPALPEARALREHWGAMAKDALQRMRPDQDLNDVDFMVNEDANGVPWVTPTRNA
jgi:hypothetical protein